MRGIDLCPGLDHGQDFSGRKIRKGEVVGGREGKDIAFSCDGLSAQEDIREVCLAVRSSRIAWYLSGNDLSSPQLGYSLPAVPSRHYSRSQIRKYSHNLDLCRLVRACSWDRGNT